MYLSPDESLVSPSPSKPDISIIRMKYFWILLTLVSAFIPAQAQQVGYLNSAQVMALLPEVKEANSQLEVFQKQYESRLKTMVEEYQKKGMELQQRIQAGEVAPKAQEEEIAKLQAEEQNINNLEQEMRQKVAEKQETLVSPIIQKLQEAIDTIAKAEGFVYVFDASPGNGILLYADPKLDITQKVMDKMGIKPEPEAE
ncbi:MAG: OmpH family outer membrane protein [Saprospiraceae bacterium]|nr:OmpH family outer membrane protein [Saprospiraceae bacterium]